MATTYLSSLQAAATITGGGGGGALPRPRPRTVICHATEPSGRRSACLSLGLGLATAAVLHAAPARADEDPEPANNGWWLTEFPLPVPKIRNSKPPLIFPMLAAHRHHVCNPIQSSNFAELN
jgi:photosystem II oxygen-evolving enhancer protein 3